MKIQVPSTHYEFPRYVDKARWASYWHQVDEVLSCAPKSVLEIGGGGGILRNILRGSGIQADTVDLDEALRPDFVASATDLPFADETYDVIACFQVLEHLPFDLFVPAVTEFARVGRARIILSLPNAAIRYRIFVHLPKIGTHQINIPKPLTWLRAHQFNGEHYWELGKKGFPVNRIIEALGCAGLDVLNTYRVPENSYHQFFICNKKKA